MHRVVALALPDVVAFDRSVPARVFGHRTERDRYAFAVCAEHPGVVPSTTNFGIKASAGLDTLKTADTVVVPGFLPLDEPSPSVLDALRGAEALDNSERVPQCLSRHRHRRQLTSVPRSVDPT